MGGDGRAGSGGEKKDPGVPGHNPKDAVPAPHPGPLISGLASTSSWSSFCHVRCLTHNFFLAEHRPAFPGAADDQFRREPPIPELQAGLH